MNRFLIRTIIYPAIPIMFFLFLFIQELNRIIALNFEIETIARIKENPVHGILPKKVIRKLREDEWPLLDTEIASKLREKYIVYTYLSKGEEYQDSISVLYANDQGIDVFYEERRGNTKIFPIYAYKNYNISKASVENDMGAKAMADKAIYQYVGLFLFAVLLSYLIYKEQFKASS